MWVKEYTAECAASPAQVFSILAEPARWSEWNAGCAASTCTGRSPKGPRR